MAVNRSPDIRRVDLGTSMSNSTSQPGLGLRADEDKSGGEDEETVS